jgi:hypothetical protein
MNRAYFFIVTACLEVVAGLLLLVIPTVPLALLLGVDQAPPEMTCLARITGAALLALGVACWPGRADKHSPLPSGLITGVLIYDVAAAGILAYTGLYLRLASIALWPAVRAPSALAVWCVGCLLVKPREEGRKTPT